MTRHPAFEPSSEPDKPEPPCLICGTPSCGVAITGFSFTDEDGSTGVVYCPVPLCHPCMYALTDE